jgi:DNA-binding MarR family transcriptional regulator
MRLHPMNAIFFGCKRAFHGCLRIARQLLHGFELTPARFDMLTAVWNGKHQGCTQRELRTKLGVTAATISRMVRSLEELGFVEGRRHEEGDRRTRWLKLTARGLSCVRRATRRIVRSGAVQHAVDCALTENRAGDETPCLQEMDAAETILNRLRRAFGDFATLYYPWNPDD